MPLQNKWVGYIERSYQQAKTAILEKLGVNAPEITDHSENEIFIKAVSVWCGLHEQLGAYVDFYGKQVFLSQTDKFKYAVLIANGFDYRVKGWNGASVRGRFTVDAPAPSDINIPQGTIVSTQGGIEFRTQEAVTINTGDTFVDVALRQEEEVTSLNLGASDGSGNQIFVIPGNVIDRAVQVIINSVSWEQVETFAFSTASDNHFKFYVNGNDEAVIEFGDGISGAIPTNGQDVVVTYLVCEAELGNVAPGIINTIVSSITLPGGLQMTITNQQRATGGSGHETLDELKKRIPLANRTKYRAVSTQDYIDILELASGVEKAGVIYNCGKIVEGFIVPIGGGLAGPTLVSQTQDYIDERKMVTTKVEVKPAGIVGMYYDITIQALPNFINSEVNQSVRNNLITFHLSTNQRIGGSVQLSDIYEVIENTRGVQHSRINIMKTVPYARPTEGTSVLTWTRNVKSGSTSTIRWTVQFTASNAFMLFRDGSFLGTFFTGSGVSTTQIDFTITSSYTIGDTFEFYTYPFGSVQLTEPSIPSLDNGNLITNTIGGVL